MKAQAQIVDPQIALVEDIAAMTHDPLSFFEYAYPWGGGSLAESDGPYEWQKNIAKLIGEHLQTPKTRFTPLRIAIASGNGIGKSALLSMLTGWGLSTFEDCKIVITAGTGKQLETKTQPEMSKWFRLAINSHWFDVKAESIKIKDGKHAQFWRADFLTWDANNPDAFLGLHNKGKRIILIYDEASAIADVIWDTSQRALTDKDTEIIWLAFGNPNHNIGRFAECFGSDKYRWHTFQIDSREVPGTNKAEIDEWIKKYGEDSDYVRYSVRGEFPRGGSNQFISSDVVAAARKYVSKGHEYLPKVLVCDVARFGDDTTEIAMRQGRKFDSLATYRGIDTEMTAQHVIEFKEKLNPDAIIIDGDGIGGGVIDHLRARGYKQGLFEFHGGAEPIDPNMYYNKRAECWGAAKDWLAAGAQIPDDPTLERELTGPTYFVARGKAHNGSICLESKEDMKKRGMASPNRGDCLAMSFAVKLAPKSPAQNRTATPATWPAAAGNSWMR